MKILIVSEFFPTGKDLKFTGGVETRNLFVSKYLAKKHQVTILTSRIKGSYEREVIFGAKVIRVGHDLSYKATAGDLINRIKFIQQAIKKGESLDADIIEGTNFITHLIAYKIAKAKKVPVVAWYPDVWLGSWIKNSGIVGILGEILERINLYLKFSTIIAISSQTKNKLIKYTSGKIIVIPCGIELSEFPKVSRKEKNVTCISRLAKYKNVQKLILAFALLSKEKKEFKLKIIGRGPEEKKLKELVKHLHLETKVDFTANLERLELVKVMSQSCILALPSEVEGFGITVIEASAAGVPYVISDIPVLKEITRNFQGGLSFKTNDIYDLFAKMSKLIEDKALYESKAKEGKKLAASYAWSKIASQTEKVYLAAIK